MPALIGYMLTIVVMLGGYLVGLQWLVSPPDPWKPNPQVQQSVAKKPPAAKSPEASQAFALTKAEAPDGNEAIAETRPVESSEREPARQPDQTAPPDQAVVQTVAHTPEPPSIQHPTPAISKPVIRKRAEKKQHARLKLMVLRTYERSDGTRFSRLLPLSSARLASYQGSEWGGAGLAFRSSAEP
jgi:hypothetical protein